MRQDIEFLNLIKDVLRPKSMNKFHIIYGWNGKEYLCAFSYVLIERFPGTRQHGTGYTPLEAFADLLLKAEDTGIPEFEEFLNRMESEEMNDTPLIFTPAMHKKPYMKKIPGCKHTLLLYINSHHS